MILFRLCLFLFLLLILHPFSFAQKRGRKRFKQDTARAQRYVEAANRYNGLQKHDSAAYYYKEAGRLYAENGLWLPSVRNYKLSGISYAKNYDDDTSWYYLEKALTYLDNLDKQTLTGLKEEEDVYLNFAHINSYLFDYYKALEYYQKGLKLFNYIKRIDSLPTDLLREASYYHFLGIVLIKLGDYQNALINYHKSLEIKKRILGENHVETGNTYANIGSLYNKKQDHEKALFYLKKSLLSLTDTINNQMLKKASVLNNIGLVYYDSGDLEKSEMFFRDALEIRSNYLNHLHISIAKLYNNLGNILLQKQDTRGAMKYYHKALNIYLSNGKKQTEDIALIYNNIAGIYSSISSWEEALVFLNKSLKIRLKIYGLHHNKVAQSYRNIGDIYYQNENYETALEYYIMAAHSNIFSTSDTINLINVSGFGGIISRTNMIDILFNIGTTYYALYNFVNQDTTYLEKSLHFFSQSVQLIETTMSEYFFESSKYNYSEKLKLILSDALDVAYELNEKTKIYEFIEKSKGQVLANLINEVSAKQESQIPDSILNKEASLKRELNYHRNELLKFKSHYSIKDSLILKNLETKNINLNLEYDSLLNYIEANFPLYKKYKNNFLIQPYKDIQEHLHIGDAMIQYFIGNKKLYILLLSKEEIFISANPISNDFFEEEVYKFLLNIKLSDYHLFANTSQKLFQILISPIYPYLKNKKKLIIIPDDYLYLVPFEALIGKTENETTPMLNKLPYLIKNFEISYHFSSSIWSLNHMKPNNSVYTYDFVGFAPVSYKHTNSQNQRSSSISKSSNTDLVSFEKRDNYFKDLPNTEKEIREIKKLFELNGKRAQNYLFSDATEENFKSNIDKSECIHIATHGFSDKINPELSGLVFSETSIDDKNNRFIEGDYFNSDNDGILYLNETFNLETAADLVVLGACETGVGKIIKGEGVLALTRGFVYSGTLNIVYTLWKIPDKLTKDFMIQFYTEILKGNSYSKALQIAKLKFIQHNSTTLPIFWSGFLLIGN